MAAVTTAHLTSLGAGDHILAHLHLYGGTHNSLSHDLPSLGVTHDFVDVTQPNSRLDKLKPETRAI